MGLREGIEAGEDLASTNFNDWALTYVMEEVTTCESGGDHSQRNPSGAFGIAQFKKKTFNWMKQMAGKPELNWTNENDQLWLLAWAIRNGYGKHWECYDRATTSLAKALAENMVEF
jgi:hypothetical protein